MGTGISARAIFEKSPSFAWPVACAAFIVVVAVTVDNMQQAKSSSNFAMIIVGTVLFVPRLRCDEGGFSVARGFTFTGTK